MDEMRNTAADLLGADVVNELMQSEENRHIIDATNAEAKLIRMGIAASYRRERW